MKEGLLKTAGVLGTVGGIKALLEPDAVIFGIVMAAVVLGVVFWKHIVGMFRKVTADPEW